MNISYQDALKIVNNKLEALSKSLAKEVICLEEHTIEKKDYWVFFYNTRIFIEKGNLSFALAGNAPLIIDKATGEMHITGTARPIEYYMEIFEKNIRPQSL